MLVTNEFKTKLLINNLLIFVFFKKKKEIEVIFFCFQLEYEGVQCLLTIYNQNLSTLLFLLLKQR